MNAGNVSGHEQEHPSVACVREGRRMDRQVREIEEAFTKRAQTDGNTVKVENGSTCTAFPSVSARCVNAPYKMHAFDFGRIGRCAADRAVALERSRSLSSALDRSRMLSIALECSRS